MKTKLTPLNILTSAFFVAAIYSLLFPKSGDWGQMGSMPFWIFALFAFISDLIFRTYVKEIKRIWIVEMAFIIFAGVLVILVQKI
ncbi:hypothetical protein [Pedobacter sp. SYSU D00535]|uniref:hypothetical protein n=1 Tax=Pedobacter sp. SYSU D00535 TaxID=2810308 RepID=UPI001A96E0A8|nr:hypothetical protein [Pedobacter sp. SYSU D00535]